MTESRNAKQCIPICVIKDQYVSENIKGKW